MWLAIHNNNRYEIIEHESAGFYVYRYEGMGPGSTHDYLQNTLEIAKDCAFEEFGVPPEAWEEAPPGARPSYEQ